MMKRLVLVAACLFCTACKSGLIGWKIDLISNHCQEKGGVGLYSMYADGGGRVTCNDGSVTNINELRAKD